ncbi:MAG TPA: C4-type zinc ribbon domain-containing protein [Candidatus Aquilonibacter sp.]|nr:C4-type zinc ribbon domain-containing protein [Candidatus Aquilonibacter sp.]
MNPDVEHLVILQAQDLELQRLRAEMAEAPRHVAAAEAACKSAGQALAKLRADLAAEEKLRRSQELDADSRRSKIVRLRRQLDAATSATQITALEHEINFAEAAIRKLEDEEIASLERTESFEASETSAAAALESSQTALESERTRAAATVDHARTAIEIIEAERKELRAQIGETSLALYDRVAKSRGSGLSEAIDHKCSACQMMVRAQRWNDLTGREHDDQIFTCETCGRILFWDPRRDTPRSWEAGQRLASAQSATGHRP